MDSNQLEKYRQEMMRFYGQRKNSADEEEKRIPQEAENPAFNEKDDTAVTPPSENDMGENEDSESEFSINFSDSDIMSEENDETDEQPENTEPPEYSSEEALGDSKGYILVYVRTGDESSAVENALVAVTATVNGKRMILASGVTDESGTSPRFEVPVPEAAYSQSPDSKKRPYNLFDVSITAEGFFNARSVDVPVFAGVTSVQNFGMIPVPLMMKSDDETITIYNQEPKLITPAESEV